MTPATPPRIGITARSADKSYFDGWVRNYWWAVTWAGGLPVLLTPDSAALPADQQVAQLDGLLLSGGGDVHPKHYQQRIDGTEKHNIHDGRDTLELGLARAALAVDLPILGVCRGLQVLNVALGGGLLQHVDGHRSPKDGVAYHEVAVAPDTLLARTLGLEGRFTVNTYHHQAVTAGRLAPGLRASAATLQGPDLLEGIEAPDRRWTLAVQWHPERFYELGPQHRRLFSAFVDVAGNRS
ncbi:MAG TPA: gamma-glutamyl-gamma-aminobutyrate hydrolase family protein [Anaerolineae bacterium]|nr:gamma-glutamyl-gamma-aminobutyrate hydrolase family protein [Anaerolineae bacterium]HNU04968.1 gamma-glutamyl-gamma-aminobutyrate hydrolase family protein [Anaerolineae bacterium]